MKAKVKVKFMGALSYQLGKEHTIELEECPSIAELLESIASSKSYYLDQESIAVYHKGEPVGLEAPACKYDELSVVRIARGGAQQTPKANRRLDRKIIGVILLFMVMAVSTWVVVVTTNGLLDMMIYEDKAWAPIVIAVLIMVYALTAMVSYSCLYEGKC